MASAADPSRTFLLRRKFMAAIRRRFARFQSDLNRLIVKEDSFGLNRQRSILTNEPYQFLTTEEQLDQFRSWLASRLDFDIIGATPQAIEQGFWHQYIKEGFLKGAARSFQDVVSKRPEIVREGGTVSKFFAGSRAQFLEQSFAQPVSVRKVKILAGRVYTELKGVTEQMAQQLTRELTDGLTQGLSPRAVARNIAKRVDVSKNRALTIARTETIRAHAEGQLDALETLGVEEVGVMVEWSTAGFDVCPLCQPLEGIVLKLSEARGMIPRHPNAVFAGSSFVPYHDCFELVRARYCGPAVVLLAGDKRTTIGPNHPMMTKRGMVAAANLRKGDEVLYDLRHDYFDFDVFDVNDKQTISVENIFESLVSIRKNSFIASSSSDLHGDREFCQGKVEAIRTTGGLLSVFDPMGIEQFRERHFMFSNSESEFVPRVSSQLFGMKSVNLPSSSVVCCTDSGILTDFVWLSVHDVSFTTFDGWAFDGSTASSLYCNNGFVVSNCRCAWIPSNVGEKTKHQIRKEAALKKALSKSVGAERGKNTKKRSIAEQRKLSKWPGATKKIAAKRPKGIL